MPFFSKDWHQRDPHDPLHHKELNEPVHPKSKEQEMGHKFSTYGTFKRRGVSKKKKKKPPYAAKVDAKSIWKRMGIDVRYVKPVDMFDESTLHIERAKGNIYHLVGINLITRRPDVLAVITHTNPEKPKKMGVPKPHPRRQKRIKQILSSIHLS